MKKHVFVRLVLAIPLLFASPRGLCADQAEDEAAIRSSAESYVAAFNRKDARALAALWAPDAVYDNPITGEQVAGREEIEKQLVSIFQASGDIKLQINVTAVDFMSPHVAVEEGIAQVIIPNESPDVTMYSAVHIKLDGRWLLDRITEQPLPNIQSNYDKLKDLEWLIGTWVDQDKEATIETTCQWTKNRNFLMRAFKVSIGDDIDLSGMQFIGWDPAENKIRSWVFDADGGFGQATWRKRGDGWVVSAAATLPDGRKSTAVNIMTVVDDSTMTWQSTGRELDGEILPNIKPINIKRKSESE